MKVEGAAAPSTPLWSFLTSEGNRYFVYSPSAKRTSYAVKYTTMSSVGASRAIPNYYCNSLLAIRRCFTSISFNSNIVITRNAYNKPCMPSSNLICSIVLNIIVCDIARLHGESRRISTHIIDFIFRIILYSISACFTITKDVVTQSRRTSQPMCKRFAIVASQPQICPIRTYQ